LSITNQNPISPKPSAMMLLTLALALAYCLATSISIVLLGDKKLIGNNLYSPAGVLSLLTNWRFVVSMALAVLSRITFILINSTLLRIPNAANAATTISAFITLLSLVFIVAVNHYFLGEALNLRQGIGAFVVLVGVFIMLGK